MKKSKILIVDDDMLISMATAELIEEIGHTALEANSADQALAILGSDPTVEIMITDYSMPGTSGIDLAASASAIRPSLRILLATGYADLPSGITTDLPRISKPFDETELRAQIASLLGEA
jgi:DNA-binding NtrC family response regulator